VFKVATAAAAEGQRVMNSANAADGGATGSVLASQIRRSISWRRNVTTDRQQAVAEHVLWERIAKAINNALTTKLL
jgi:hypothetical protein